MAVMLVASGHGLIAVRNPSTPAVIHGALLFSNMPVRNSFTENNFQSASWRIN